MTVVEYGMKVYVTDNYPFYHIWVDGVLFDTLTARSGPRLTHSQLVDIAKGYREGLDGGKIFYAE